MRLSIPDLLEKHSIPEPNSGCLLWTASVSEFGHGQVRVDGKLRPAHRVSWEQVNGPMPDHLFACHKCDVASCIEPAHVYPGTHRQNMDDMLARERQVRGEKNGQSKVTDEIVMQIRARSGTNVEIAAEFGISETAVCVIRSGRRWKHLPDAQPAGSRPAPPKYGINNGRAVLTPEQVEIIRKTVGQTAELARLYGVNRSTIQRVRNGQRWHA